MAAVINNIPDFNAMGRALLKRIPHDVGQMGLSHFKGSFRKQGFTDHSFMAWVQTKDDLGHKILRDTNSLMNDVKVRKETMKRVEISATLPWASIHNNGGKYSITLTDKMRRFFWYMYKETGQEKWKWMALTKKKRLPIRIPQRQFIGNSHVLNNQIDKHIISLIIKTFNQR
jgi:phage gpG-like protein